MFNKLLAFGILATLLSALGGLMGKRARHNSCPNSQPRPDGRPGYWD